MDLSDTSLLWQVGLNVNIGCPTEHVEWNKEKWGALHKRGGRDCGHTQQVVITGVILNASKIL